MLMGMGSSKLKSICATSRLRETTLFPVPAIFFLKYAIYCTKVWEKIYYSDADDMPNIFMT